MSVALEETHAPAHGFPERLVAVFFWCYFLLNSPYKIIMYGLHDTLWYCDFLMLLCAAAFFLRLPWLYSALLVQCLVLQFTWLVDASLYAMTGIYFTREAEYLFGGGLPAFDVFLTMRHFFTVPLLVWAVSLRPFTYNLKRAIVFNVAVYAVVEGTVLLLSDAEDNVSCAFNPCQGQIFGFPVGDFDSVAAYQFVFFTSLQSVLLFISLALTALQQRISMRHVRLLFFVTASFFATAGCAVVLRWAASG